MIGRIVTVVILLGVVGLFWVLVSSDAPTELGSVSRHYVESGLIENRGSNLVTSVVVNYRGLDTLGEVAVLFLSVTGVAFVLRRRRGAGAQRRRKATLTVPPGETGRSPPANSCGPERDCSWGR